MKANLPRKANTVESLYVKYAPALLSVCLRYCGNLADAEDVLHEGFIKIIRTFRNSNTGQMALWDPG